MVTGYGTNSISECQPALRAGKLNPVALCCWCTVWWYNGGSQDKVAQQYASTYAPAVESYHQGIPPTHTLARSCVLLVGTLAKPSSDDGRGSSSVLLWPDHVLRGYGELLGIVRQGAVSVLVFVGRFGLVAVTYLCVCRCPELLPHRSGACRTNCK